MNSGPIGRALRGGTGAALLLGLGLLALGIVYQPSYGAPLFLVDDDELVAAPQLQGPLAFKTLATILTPGQSPDYYPVRDLSYLVDLKLFGDRWTFFRLHQALIFAQLAVVVFFIQRALAVPAALAGAITLAWAAHPVHAEMICWLGARREVLALAFGAYAVLSFLWAVKRDSPLLYGLALLAFCLGLLSKASVTPLPALGVGAAAVGAVGWRRRRALLALGTATVLGGVSAAFTSWYYRAVNNMSFPYSASYRLRASAAALGKMAAGWVWPPLNVVDGENWGEWLSLQSGWVPVGVIVWIALLAGLTAAIVRRRKIPGLTLAGFLLLYLPISGLPFPHRNFYSVRYLEPAALILTIGSAVGLGRWLAARARPVSIGARRTSAAILVIAMVVLMAATRVEARTWAQPLAVVDKALRDQPASVALKALRLVELRRASARGPAGPDQETEAAQAAQELESLCTATDLDRLASCVGYWSMRLADEPPAPSQQRAQVLARATAWLDDHPVTAFWGDTMRFESALRDGTVQRETVLRWRDHRRWPIKAEFRLLAWVAACFEQEPTAAGDLGRMFEQRLLAPRDAANLVAGAHPQYRPTLTRCLP